MGRGRRRGMGGWLRLGMRSNGVPGRLAETEEAYCRAI